MTTERDVLDVLHRRYSKVSQGLGERWVAAEHVRSAAGFDATRTCDFMAQDTWPGAGLALHGFEVKCSRSDWLRELKTPDKALMFRAFCDYWWLVAADDTIAAPAELPPGWGLLVVTRTRAKLRAVVPAPRLTPEPMPRTMQVALLRAAVKTAPRRSSALTVGPALDRSSA